MDGPRMPSPPGSSLTGSSVDEGFEFPPLELSREEKKKGFRYYY
jgi:hypothetical protein